MELEKQIKAVGMNKKRVAEKLGVTPPTFRARMEDPDSFTIREVKILNDMGIFLQCQLNSCKFG